MAYDNLKTADKPDPKEEGTLIDTLHIDGVVEKGYVPEGFESQEDFLKCLRRDYEDDIEFDRINRNEALDDKKFSAGEQWDPIVLEQRKGLPCLVINSIPQFTAQLVGDWRQDKKGVKVVPSNDEDTNVASVRGDLIRSIETASRADRIYDSAFESLVQCGDGAVRVSVEYARDDVFDQDIFIRGVEDCLSVVWDRFSVDVTGRDAKRVFIDDRLPKKEFEAKWPGIDPDSLSSDQDIDKVSLVGWVDDSSYRVTEYWRMIERQRVLALFQNGKIFELDETNIVKAVEENGPPVKTRLVWCSFAQMHLVTGFAILSGPYEYRLNRLPIIRMSGRVVNIGGRRVRYGLVRFMKDPVRLKNFWRSVAAEQLGYASKAQWIAPESAVEGREETFRKSHLSRDPLLVYNDGAEAPPQRLDPPAPQAALLNEANVNAQDMKDVTGIHDASLGIKSNETSGRAIQARQREGDVASLTFYDNGNACVLEVGDVINQLIPQIYDGTRIIRTIGEDEAVKFQKINDPMNPESVDLSIGQFDVALTTGASYSTRRVEAAQAMMEAVQVFPQLMTVAGDLVAKAQDWPGADKIAERLEMAMQGQQTDPAQLAQLQEELAKTTQKLQALEADRSIDLKKIEIETYNAETQRIRALSDNEVDANQLELQAIAHILDGTKELDRQDAANEKDEIRLTLEQSKHALAEKQHAENVKNNAAALKAAQNKPSPSAPSSSGSGKKTQPRSANG